MRRLAGVAARGVTAAADSIQRQNKALSDLIRGGRIAEARRLFDSLTHRSVVTWNAMMSGYLRRQEVAAARALFDEMPERDLVSYNCMLSGYASSREPSELEEAKRLFDSMPERDPISWNTMINAYARNGRMANAMMLFESMPEGNVVSWNTMITGFLGTGDIRMAVELFEQMPARDSASLGALISGLIHNGRLEDAEKILTESNKVDGIEGSVDAYNTLIAGYAQSGRVDEARGLFDSIPCRQGNGKKNHKNKGLERNVVSWNSMIMCYIKAGDICSARALFDAMPERDLISWNTMIAGHVQALEMDEAVSLFQRLPDPDVRSWNSMICGFTQKGEVERAREYFDRMPHKSLVSWNTMIAGYEQNGHYDGAIELFSKMQACERPDRHTLSSALSACAGLATLHQGTQIHCLTVKTIVADIPINNSLITMYMRCGRLLDGKAVFEGMRSWRDVVSWNAMIGGYAQHGLAGEALVLFKEMKKMRVRPTYITFISVLNACGHAGLVAEGRREFKSMVHDFKIMPRTEHYASLVDLIGRHGQLENAMNVIDGMVIPPDRAVWGALLGACRVHNNVALASVAAEALRKIEPESSAPYVLMHNMHVDDGRWDDAVEVREMMDRQGILKQPGYSWIELKNKVHIFLAGDRYHPLSNDIYKLLEICNKIIKDVQVD